MCAVRRVKPAFGPVRRLATGLAITGLRVSPEGAARWRREAGGSPS